MRPRISKRGSVHPSIGPFIRLSVGPYVTRVFSRMRENESFQLSRLQVWQGEGIGRDEGAGKGARERMTGGTHLTAMCPALLDASSQLQKKVGWSVLWSVHWYVGPSVSPSVRNPFF